jgi:hypothetical protein
MSSCTFAKLSLDSPFYHSLLVFFNLKPHPKSGSTSVLGGCGIQFHQSKQKEYFEYTLVDSVKD